MELHLEQFLLDTFLLQPFSKCAPRLALCNYFTVIGCRFRESLSQVLETISLILWRRYCQIKARRNLSQRGAEARVMSFDTGKPNIVLLLAASRTWPHFGFLKWKFRFYNFGMGAANNLTALKKKPQLVFKRAALQSVGFTCDLFIWAGPSPAYTHTSLSYALSTWCPHTPKIFTMVGSVPSLQSTLCTTDSTSWCTTAPTQTSS